MSNHHFRSQTLLCSLCGVQITVITKPAMLHCWSVSLMSIDASALPDVDIFLPHRLLTWPRLLLLNPSTPKKGHIG